VRWRRAEELPPAPRLLSAPSAPDARSGTKRATAWTGDKVHVRDTCDDATPPLSTAVTPPPATTAAFALWPPLQAPWAPRQLTPREPSVAVGSGTADHLLTSRTAHGLARRGPVRADQSGQEQAANGFAAAPCVIDWAAT
jgi:hypothetical protein